MMKVARQALVVALTYCPLLLQADPITYIDSLKPGDAIVLNLSRFDRRFDRVVQRIVQFTYE